ncbi:hypothetical protein [Xanthocytophaga agilis]|uniref:Secretion system C-terminal sorting domain-containing protein n=1 Tax=Xanthocytophaga agilis TaxID=3048010 RepID=A0AAE3UIP2_9BACT|nr:hypothetical protein [Xanthocytophaga agilis]MDJ1506850.1 hypothetical protein [Xanthocytophaga agilis]
MKRLSLIVLLTLISLVAYSQTKPKSKTKKSKTTASTSKSTSSAKTTTSTGSASVNNTALYQKWVNSFEDEKGDGIEVYRPEGYAFPPARGRKAIKFQKEGMVVRFDIGPADGQKIVMGQWERTKFGNTMKVTVQGAESGVYFLEVISVSKDILKVKRKSEI